MSTGTNSNTSTNHASIEVELVYKNSCQAVEKARESIQIALSLFGLEPDWQEWVQEDTMTPNYVQSLHSPTVLVNEQDVSKRITVLKETGERVYVNEKGEFSSSPSISLIAEAIDREIRSGKLKQGSRWMARSAA